MKDYFVVAPFEVLTEDELIERRSELIRAGRKVIAVVFNCKDYEDFKRKYYKD